MTHVRRFDELPENAQKYLRRIEELIGVQISIFSVGPDREQTIVQKEIYN
ncbi:adenylosuccinate synthetase [Piscibacillus salipiscarius]|nr:adenylosuccinate synthetase [Piscibacillus salipiscarius]